MTELPREWVLKLNVFEVGFLTGLIADSKHHQGALKKVFFQLMDFKEKMEKMSGVTKEILPNGMLKMTNSDGIVIIRSPYEWEKDALLVR